METAVAIVACILAVAAVTGLIAALNSQQRHVVDLHRLAAKQHDQMKASTDKLIELSEVDFVAKHLQKQGVAPYLLAASDKIARDIQEVMDLLGCERDEAIQHIRRGVLGIEPTEHRGDG